ncbi:MAG: hypothetical protein ACE5RA_05360 [Nitrosopumilus sp.]
MRLLGSIEVAVSLCSHHGRLEFNHTNVHHAIIADVFSSRIMTSAVTGA